MLGKGKLRLQADYRPIPSLLQVALFPRSRGQGKKQEIANMLVTVICKTIWGQYIRNDDVYGHKMHWVFF